MPVFYLRDHVQWHMLTPLEPTDEDQNQESVHSNEQSIEAKSSVSNFFTVFS